MCVFKLVLILQNTKIKQDYYNYIALFSLLVTINGDGFRFIIIRHSIWHIENDLPIFH